MQTATQNQRRRAGFTLAEMMVVIVIIGILATVVVPNVWQKFFAGQRAKVKVDIMAIDSALREYAMNNAGKYPDSLDPLITPDANGQKYLQMNKLPKDPWNNEYGYEPPAPGNPNPRIFTYGKDGMQGGEGDDADIDIDMIRDGDVK